MQERLLVCSSYRTPGNKRDEMLTLWSSPTYRLPRLGCNRNKKGIGSWPSARVWLREKRKFFAGENFHELLKVGFSRLKLSRTVGIDNLWVWQVTTPSLLRGEETTNEIELARTRWMSYEMVTGDRGYHVYVTVLEAAVGKILPCQQEGGSIHDSLRCRRSRDIDTPMIMTLTLSLKNFTVKTIANCLKTTKFAKVFTQFEKAYGS